jgi:hypothetical protein
MAVRWVNPADDFKDFPKIPVIVLLYKKGVSMGLM